MSQEFKDLCAPLFKSPLKLICSGVVPPQHCREHKCFYMSGSDPYSIFQLEAKKSLFLLFFRYLEMSECRTIELLDLHNVLCVDHLNKSKNLFFGFSHRLCYDHSMQLTKDLRRNCNDKAFYYDSLSGYYFANLQTDSKLLLYEIRDCACGLFGSPILMLCLLMFLALVFCLRWRY